MAGKTISSGKGVYELGERIGVGSMAEVFSARAVTSGERVAVKRLLPSLAADEEFITMFIDEARIGCLVDHEVLDLGKSGDAYFMVQEFVDGHPAAAFLERVSPRERDAMVCHVVGRVALALDHLHTLVDDKGQAAKVIHRDVCPNNILVGVDGVPRLIDLGIARAASHLRYTSPDLVRGLPLDGRCDLYALGIVLYEWLAGQPAYTFKSDFELLEKVRYVDIVPLRVVRADVPALLNHVVARALAREPDDRYPTAAAMANDLLEAVRELGLERSTAAVAATVARAFPRVGSVGSVGSVGNVLDDLEAVPSGRPRG
jgi:serine/threonine protein kinase